MVILSAQVSDSNINKLATTLFEKFPNIESLNKSNIEEFSTYIHNVKNYPTKANQIINIAQILKKDENIPTNLKDLISLKGIGRKSVNVILREIKQPTEGIIVDLHVIRVSPRIGITLPSKDGNKIEKGLMQVLPKEIWSEIGMAISFLGREICRPTLKCNICPIKKHCNYYKNN